MTAKEYLEQILRLESMVQNKLDEANRLKELAGRTSSGEGGAVKRKTESDRVGALVPQAVFYEEQARALAAEWMRYRQQAIFRIDHMPDARHYQVLTLKYVRGMRMGEIATAMHYSKKQIGRILDDAIIAFGVKYGNECGKMSLNEHKRGLDKAPDT